MPVYVNRILVPVVARDDGKPMKTALLQLKAVPLRTVARKNEYFSGFGLSMDTSHESEKHPPFTSTLPVTKSSLFFVHERLKNKRVKIGSKDCRIAFFPLTTPV